jgi:hypothetical protein
MKTGICFKLPFKKIIMKALLIILLYLLASTVTIGQTKRALIISIGNYSEQKTGWPPLSSKNDVPYIKTALEKQGFTKERIQVLSDEKATRAGISAALGSLIQNSEAGDIVVIHISSHGVQIEDDNGDETDGLDEAIVTINAVYRELSPDFKKDQEEYFRDDLFGMFIDQLRSKLGSKGDVVVFMDLCHSGTGTRGITRVRGGKPPMVSPGFNAKQFAGKKDLEDYRETSRSRGNEAGLATYEVFSAARAEQLANEIINEDNNRNIQMGSLSYAVSKAFQNLKPGTTYQSLFSSIQAVFDDKVPGQQAVLEGNGNNRALFAGKSVNQKPFIEIEHFVGRELRLKAGLLAGLDTGAIVAVYPSGTIDPANLPPLARGKVVSADSYTATVNLDKDPKLRQPSSGWVFVTAPVYNPGPIVIRLAPEDAFSSQEAAGYQGRTYPIARNQFQWCAGTADREGGGWGQHQDSFQWQLI